ncbi:penicillin-binding protein 1B [Pseudohongiella sp. SYSU M77423]|uniref:penicillin-binding protein 1B n=1 Tax=Pseudohongiella sp. SYSU M77423 TaxID=3042312 RepID=UPI0024814FE7|nr:penicillin-binding protein 1B [Pseudohongiella sp. SYSU M77423]MDH7943344.1 penicillin-binding protein 1B [Pseudohongiella sp. SYSU M77423]
MSRLNTKLPSLRRLTVWTLLIATVVFVLWCVWIDRQIRESFSSLQWALPARIYARPMELYPGAGHALAEVQTTLQQLGYREVAQLNRPGEFRRLGQSLQIQTRGFDFWDGPEPPQTLAVFFTGERISSLERIGGGAVPLARLEPVEVTQFNPDTGEDRLPLALGDVPPALVQAVIAVEDSRFYEHHGVDPKGIARAMLANIRAGGIVQGGSTLTQQLVKNLYLHRDQTFRRKIEEALMAVALDLRFSKEQILEAYLNEVYLGQDGNRAIHGFALGAQHYFSRPLTQLSLDELALLAGMPRGPSLYNPRRNPERAVSRRNTVLARMVDAGYITDEQRTQASRAELAVTPRPAYRGNGYPAFMELVQQNLARDYDSAALRTEGLRIFTTLDLAMQTTLEARLDKAVAAVQPADGDNGPLEAAVVITDATNGDVRALAGGRRAGYTGFNRALNARRQIGSLVKPATYLAALESGAGDYSLATVLSDAKREIELDNGTYWSPSNYENRYYGDVYLFDALERSLNQATVDLGLKLGLPATIDMLRRLGYNGDVAAYPSLLLGAVDMTPIEVAQMYQTLASGGFRTPLRAVEAVMTGDGQRLQRYGLAIEQVASQRSMFLLEHALQGVFSRGTARTAQGTMQANLPLAGKTGTTNDLRDSWFAGYGDDLVAVVWLGHDNNGATGLTGATGALKVWSDIMSALRIEPRTTAPPPDIEWRQVSQNAVRDPAYRQCQDSILLPFADSRPPDRAVDCEDDGSLFNRVLDRFRVFSP